MATPGRHFGRRERLSPRRGRGGCHDPGLPDLVRHRPGLSGAVRARSTGQREGSEAERARGDPGRRPTVSATPSRSHAIAMSTRRWSTGTSPATFHACRHSGRSRIAWRGLARSGGGGGRPEAAPATTRERRPTRVELSVAYSNARHAQQVRRGSGSVRRVIPLTMTVTMSGGDDVQTTDGTARDREQSGASRAFQATDTIVDDATYDLLQALTSKLEAIEAYEQYGLDGNERDLPRHARGRAAACRPARRCTAGAPQRRCLSPRLAAEPGVSQAPVSRTSADRRNENPNSAPPSESGRAQLRPSIAWIRRAATNSARPPPVSPAGVPLGSMRSRRSCSFGSGPRSRTRTSTSVGSMSTITSIVPPVG